MLREHHTSYKQKKTKPHEKQSFLCQRLRQKDAQTAMRHHKKREKRRYKPGFVTEAVRTATVLIYARAHARGSSDLPPGSGRAILECRYTWSCNPPVVQPHASLHTLVGFYPAFSPLPRKFQKPEPKQTIRKKHNLLTVGKHFSVAVRQWTSLLKNPGRLFSVTLTTPSRTSSR